MATRSQNLGFWIALAAGTWLLWSRSKAATAPSKGITAVSDSAGNTYYLDANGIIVGAEDASGNVIPTPSMLPPSASPSYYPPGSLQNVYL